MGVDISTSDVLDTVWEDVAPGGSRGTAESATIRDKSWGCKHSRRSTEYVENLESSTKEGTRSLNSNSGWK
eukprot:12880824-Prorocentrum_lima.AAC.1